MDEIILQTIDKDVLTVFSQTVVGMTGDIANCQAMLDADAAILITKTDTLNEMIKRTVIAVGEDYDGFEWAFDDENNPTKLIKGAAIP